MKSLHELAADAPLNVRRIVGRIDRIGEVLAREAEPLCTEVEALLILERLPSLFGDEGAKELLGFVLKLSQLNQATPGGEALLSENFITQALAPEPAKVEVPTPKPATVDVNSTLSEPVAKAGKTSKKPN